MNHHHQNNRNMNRIEALNNFYRYLGPPDSDYMCMFRRQQLQQRKLLQEQQQHQQQQQQQLMRMRNSVDAQTSDPLRFVSFLEVGHNNNNSFFTPWNRNTDLPKEGQEQDSGSESGGSENSGCNTGDSESEPSSSKNGGCNNGANEYMKFEPGSFFAHEVHDLKLEQTSDPS